MKRLFKLIEGTAILGEIEVVKNEAGMEEILIKHPFEVKNQRAFPYMADVIGESPGAVQIHPMNVLWSVPLDEFPELEKVYTETTSGIITQPKSKIIV